MKAKIQFISAMLIFGSLGLFVRPISVSSAALSLMRGILASVFLIAFVFFSRQTFSFAAVRKNLHLLLFSSAAMAFNWIFLFQAYKYTTIANATLSYYCAPIIVVLLAPVILKDTFSWQKLLCVVVAMFGMLFIVKSSPSQSSSYDHIKGIFFGLCAAGLYASVILTNKFFKDLSGLEATLMQLIFAVAVLLPYLLIFEPFSPVAIPSSSVPYILILGLFHTGFAYLLYFTGVKHLPASSIASLSYLDPISAVLFSAVLLSEPLNFFQILGGIFIIGSAFFSQKKPKSLNSADTE